MNSRSFVIEQNFLETMLANSRTQENTYHCTVTVGQLHKNVEEQLNLRAFRWCPRSLYANPPVGLGVLCPFEIVPEKELVDIEFSKDDLIVQ